MILVTTLNTCTISSPSPIWHPFLLYNRSSDEVYSAGDDKHNSCCPAGGESKGDCQYLDSSQIVSTFYMTQSTVGLHMVAHIPMVCSASRHEFVVERNIFRPSVNIFTWHSWAVAVSGRGWAAVGSWRDGMVGSCGTQVVAGRARQLLVTSHPPPCHHPLRSTHQPPVTHSQWSKCQVMGILVISSVWFAHVMFWPNQLFPFMDIFFLVDFVDIHFITNSSNNIVNHQCLTF